MACFRLLHDDDDDDGLEHKTYTHVTSLCTTAVAVNQICNSTY